MPADGLPLGQVPVPQSYGALVGNVVAVKDVVGAVDQLDGEVVAEQVEDFFGGSHHSWGWPRVLFLSRV